MLVGRDDVLGEARDRLDMALRGSGSTLLLVGEAGVGKTRLAQEIARVAVDTGFELLWGSCWSGPECPAYWPWTQLLRSHAATASKEQLAADLGDDTAQLDQIAPGIAGDVTAASTRDATAEDRWRLLDTAASFFVRASARRPLCLVIDDIHGADPSSIELLGFLATRIPGERLVAVATRRLNEPRPGPSAQALDGLTEAVHAMELHGLAPSDAAALFAEVTGTKPSDELAEAIYRQSGGNPLFVRELARLLLSQGHLADPEAHSPVVPAAVEPVIARRAQLLNAQCRTFLEAASVLGTEFAATDAAALAGEAAPASAVRAAEHAGLVIPPPRASGHHRFAHGIVREVMYAGITDDRRSALHRLATELPSIGPDELLYHYEQAGGPDDLLAGLSYAESLARHALDRLAFDEAADLARRGLRLAEQVGAADERVLQLRLTLGTALNRAMRQDEARPVLLEAVALARDLEDHDAFADAALQFGILPQREALGGMGAHPAMLALVEEALPNHPVASAYGVLLRWRLCMELNYVDPDRVATLGREALEGARAIDDPLALGRALEVRGQIEYYRKMTAWDRLDIATEICDLGRDHDLPDLEMSGHIWRTVSLIQVGDTAAVDREIGAAERLVERARLRVNRWFPALWRAMRTVHDGRVEEAEHQAAEALAEGETFGQGAFDHYGMQLMAIRREQGRMDEIIDLISAGAEQYPEIPAYRGALAMAYAETGRTASAQAELDLLAPDNFAIIPDDYNRGVALMTLSIACMLVGDKDHAAALLHRWSGLEDEFVSVGYGAISGGSARYFVGGLHLVLGERDSAVEHLERALVRNREEGAVLWATRAEIALAQALAGTNADRARELAHRARATVDELGLVSAGKALEAVEAMLDAGPSRSVPMADAAVFLREGTLWKMTFESTTVHVRDAKGIHDIARLLAVPGQEIHALQLMTGGEPVPVPAAADTVIDDEAARAYRDRINELHEEIDDAEAMADVGRAEKARVELELLTDELTAAFGLGGRPRKTGADPAERARKAVTARIRDSIKRVAAAHAELGTHLDRSINTGTFLSYTPDRTIRWKVDT